MSGLLQRSGISSNLQSTRSSSIGHYLKPSLDFWAMRSCEHLPTALTLSNQADLSTYAVPIGRRGRTPASQCRPANADPGGASCWAAAGLTTPLPRPRNCAVSNSSTRPSLPVVACAQHSFYQTDGQYLQTNPCELWGTCCGNAHAHANIAHPVERRSWASAMRRLCSTVFQVAMAPLVTSACDQLCQ